MLVLIADAVRVPVQQEQRPGVVRVLQEGSSRTTRLLEASQSGAQEPRLDDAAEDLWRVGNDHVAH